VLLYEYVPNVKDMVVPSLSYVPLGPAVVVKLDSRPISRVEVGFHGGRVYVYGLFREERVINGEKCELCSVRKAGIRADIDWPRIEKKVAC
jgi:hypothetical protein